MEKTKELEKVAEFLSRNIVTIWHDYDYNERTSEIEKRVPKIHINVSGIKELSEKTYIAQDTERVGVEYYTREYRVEYKEQVYAFKVIAIARSGIISRFSLEVYIPQDNEMLLILKESL